MSQKSKWIKRIILLIIAVASATWMAAGLGPDPILVEVGKAVRGPLVVTVDGTGKTRMKDRQTVFAPTSGDLLRIALRPGDVVTAGQVIAEIEPGLSQPLDPRSRAEIAARLAATRASLAEAKRNVERTQIAADLAKSETERTRYLVETKSVPTRTLEVAEADEKTRAAELELAKLAVERARLEAEAVSVSLRDPSEKKGKSAPRRIEVRAPASGVVLRAHTESAGPVQIGAPLIDIGAPNTVELVVDLPTQSAVRVVLGAKVTVDSMGDNKTRSGVVRLVEPAAYTKVTALGVEEQRVDVIVTLTDPPLVSGDGFSADAHIEVQKTADVIKVPSGAVFREGSEFAVFTVEKDRAKLVRVRAKSRNADEVEIEGLKLGTAVVIHPSDKLKDGVLVSVE